MDRHTICSNFRTLFPWNFQQGEQAIDETQEYKDIIS